MTEMICGELHLKAVKRAGELRQGHHPSIVH
jgi:hypothetical protein